MVWLRVVHRSMLCRVSSRLLLEILPHLSHHFFHLRAWYTQIHCEEGKYINICNIMKCKSWPMKTVQNTFLSSFFVEINNV